MNEKLSALMDGELDCLDATRAIQRLDGDAASRATWDVYQLVGEILRGEPCDAADCLQRRRDALFARLADEPIMIAPGALRTRPVANRTRLALAAAASVATVSAIGVVAFKLQQNSATASVQLVQQVPPQPAPARPAATADVVRVNDYLMLHRQFASPANVQPVSAGSGEREKAAQ